MFTNSQFRNSLALASLSSQRFRNIHDLLQHILNLLKLQLSTIPTSINLDHILFRNSTIPQQSNVSPTKHRKSLQRLILRLTTRQPIEHLSPQNLFHHIPIPTFPLIKLLNQSIVRCMSMLIQTPCSSCSFPSMSSTVHSSSTETIVATISNVRPLTSIASGILAACHPERKGHVLDA
jgi:hypothetical protein